MIRKVFVLTTIMLVFLCSLGAEPSIHDVMSGFPEANRNDFLDGKTIELYSLDGEDVPGITFDGTFAKEKALRDCNDPSCFVQGLSSLVSYPESWKNLSFEERKLNVLNALLSVSSIKGITYLAHSAGDKPKVLFEDSYTILDAKSKKKASDAQFTFAPENYEYQVNAYLKDSVFGGNTYIINYTIRGPEIFVEITNSSKLKLAVIKAVDKNELSMCVDVLLTEEGIAVNALATVYRDEDVIKTPVGNVHLQSAFMKRIDSLKNWFIVEINK